MLNLLFFIIETVVEFLKWVFPYKANMQCCICVFPQEIALYHIKNCEIKFEDEIWRWLFGGKLIP